jgi:hypothetical protein
MDILLLMIGLDALTVIIVSVVVSRSIRRWCEAKQYMADPNAQNILFFIGELTYEEGSSVEIFCDNPDPPPGSAVEVTAGWTNWKPRRFEGKNLCDALLNAGLASQKAGKP